MAITVGTAFSLRRFSFCCCCWSWAGCCSGAAHGAAVAATTNPGPIDVASSGSFLYVETGVTGTVDGFLVGPDGALVSIGSVDDLPAGIEGIAAT